MSLNKVYKHEIEMTNGEKVVVVIKAEDELTRKTFLKAFLENYKDDKYFSPEGSDKLYNKEYIYSAVLLKE